MLAINSLPPLCVVLIHYHLRRWKHQSVLIQRLHQASKCYCSFVVCELSRRSDARVNVTRSFALWCCDYLPNAKGYASQQIMFVLRHIADPVDIYTIMYCVSSMIVYEQHHYFRPIFVGEMSQPSFSVRMLAQELSEYGALNNRVITVEWIGGIPQLRINSH
jgi:hypothetical protein